MSSTPKTLTGLLYSGGKLMRADQRSATALRPVEIVPNYISSAEGSALIRLFVDDLFKVGASRTVADPDPGNARAIRAYEKAGFQKDRLVETPDGRALLMVRDA